MRNRVWLAVLLLGTLAQGSGCGDPGSPNGDRHVLFFAPEYEALPVGIGLSETITIPRQVTLGDTPKSVSRIEHYNYDFEGTTLTFTGTSGLTVLTTALDDRGWHVVLTCLASPAVLGVVVQSNDRAKYADTTQVPCRAGLTLDVKPISATPSVNDEPSFEFLHYVQGATTSEVSLSLRDAAGTALSGHGIQGGSVLLSPLTPGTDQVPAFYSFIAQQPGQATVVVGDASFDLPFDVVSDDVWSYVLVPLSDASGGTQWQVDAHLPDGTLEPIGQPCDLLATSSDGTLVWVSSGACIVPVLSGHGQICVSNVHKPGCVDY